MFRRSNPVLASLALVMCFSAGSHVMAGDVLLGANAEALSTAVYLRDEQAFPFTAASEVTLNGISAVPRIQTMTAHAAESWRGISSDSADINSVDSAAFGFGTPGANDSWLMLLVGAGLVVLQLRRKQKTLQQRMLAPG